MLYKLYFDIFIDYHSDLKNECNQAAQASQFYLMVNEGFGWKRWTLEQMCDIHRFFTFVKAVFLLVRK